MSKYGVFSGPYNPVFELNTEFIPNTGKYGPEKTPSLDTFYAVFFSIDFGTWKSMMLSLSLSCINFCPYIFVYGGKDLDKNASINFKISDVAKWEINNYNILIGQYLKKWKQSDNEIWSVKRM